MRTTKIDIFTRLVMLLVLITPMQKLLAIENSFDKPYLHPAIPLLDESGDHVLNSGGAYSSKMSCGSSSCHDYDAITKAYHFEMGRGEASDDYGAKRGVPQLVSPGYFGGYNCMGGSKATSLAKKNNPNPHDFADYGSPGIAKKCANCHTGGGYMEYDRDGIRYDEKDVSTINPFDGDYFTRISSDAHGASGASHIEQWDWKKTGVVEADCMLCHADFSAMKQFPASGLSPLAKQDAATSLSFWKSLRKSKLIDGDFFREANSAFWEFYDIAPGTADGKQLVSFERSIIEGKETSSTGYDLILNADGKPKMHWNAAAFDANKKVVIPMLRFPANDNCMACHRTSNSRRGFYGYGDEATMDLGEDGTFKEDYKDDVHKGKTWTADNGEVRKIENCNTCHSRNYLKPAYANMDLSADHNFLKGNSDMDLRNDLDYDDNAKSCEYCHDDSNHPVVPSGQDSMLSAHKELWKANGDMTGYTSSTLEKITKTHLDVVSCQACHITDKVYYGKPMQIMYRYRQGEDGKYKIMPYNPKIRYYWKDKNSDRVLSSEEIKSVFDVRTDTDGKLYAVIVDPVSGEDLAKVTASSGMHGVSYGEPETYEDFVSLKKAYDKLMSTKGHFNTNMQQIWIESNEYIMSHNVRSSPESVQCEECHNRKQSGAFSSLVSTDSILGAKNVKTVAEIPDKRLIDEGYVVLGHDYFKVDNDGVITENVDDILYSTKVNPFMSILKASSATINNGQFKESTLATAMAEITLNNAFIDSVIQNSNGSGKVYLYNSHQGDPELKGSAIVVRSSGSADMVIPTYRVESEVIKNVSDEVKQRLNEVLPNGKIASSIYRHKVIDSYNKRITTFSDKVYVKLPYSGTSSNINEVEILYLSDNSTSIKILDKAKIVSIQPQSEAGNGYVIFHTDSLGYFIAMNR